MRSHSNRSSIRQRARWKRKTKKRRGLAVEVLKRRRVAADSLQRFMHPLEQLREDALREIEAARDEQALEAARVKYLGKNGSVSAGGEKIKTLEKPEKPVIGKLLNEVRNAVTAAIETRNAQFRSEKESGVLAKIDISLPGTPPG